MVKLLISMTISGIHSSAQPWLVTSTSTCVHLRFNIFSIDNLHVSDLILLNKCSFLLKFLETRCIL